MNTRDFEHGVSLVLDRSTQGYDGVKRESLSISLAPWSGLELTTNRLIADASECRVFFRSESKQESSWVLDTLISVLTAKVSRNVWPPKMIRTVVNSFCAPEYFPLNLLVCCPYKRDVCRPTEVSLRFVPKGNPFGGNLGGHLSWFADIADVATRVKQNERDLSLGCRSY
jgi:hypothetical protein